MHRISPTLAYDIRLAQSSPQRSPNDSDAQQWFLGLRKGLDGRADQPLDETAVVLGKLQLLPYLASRHSFTNFRNSCLQLACADYHPRNGNTYSCTYWSKRQVLYPQGVPEPPPPGTFSESGPPPESSSLIAGFVRYRSMRSVNSARVKYRRRRLENSRRVGVERDSLLRGARLT